MEQDKNLQKILLLGAETASMDFTATVMKTITELSAPPFYNQPLVSNTLKKIFLVTVGILVALILLLALMISSPPLPATHQSTIRFFINYLYEHYNKIAIFILSFWVVFVANSLFEKKRFSFRRLFSFNGN